MLYICNCVEQCSVKSKRHCGHIEPHEIEWWGSNVDYEDYDGTDCTSRG